MDEERVQSSMMALYVNRLLAQLRLARDVAIGGASYAFKSKTHKAMPTLAHVEPLEQITPIVQRVLGHNPGPFTLQGTNTYLIGTGKEKILIDTGEPNIPEYITALKTALKEAVIKYIVITHHHNDHVGGISGIVSEILKNEKVPIYKMKRESDEHAERYDYIEDGFKLTVEGATLKFIHTPGHTADHFAIWLEEESSLFSGDCILGEGTTVFEDLFDYMNSLQKIKKLSAKRIYPGHGPVIDAVDEKVDEYIEHRMIRERQILAVLRANDEVSSMDITNTVYSTAPWSVRLAALNNVKQVLNKLVKEGIVINTFFEMYKLTEVPDM